MAGRRHDAMQLSELRMLLRDPLTAASERSSAGEEPGLADPQGQRNKRARRG
jgi:hypothetical protein